MNDRPGLPPGVVPRLLHPTPLSLDAHLARHGPLPTSVTHLVDHVAASGLRGRGGAGFPTATKMAAVARSGRRPVIVGNGTEGEPASAKDRVLMLHEPHLVLDGVSAAASVLDAASAVVCVDVIDAPVAEAMERAVDDRRRRHIDRVDITIARAPHRYVAGEETALVAWLDGHDAKPTFTPPRPFERGVRNRPTLVDNVETLAHIGLIARYGSDWFRSVGDPSEPGTFLTTVSGAVAAPGVLEVPSGTPMLDVLDRARGPIDGIGAFLVGGYFGTWIPTMHASTLAFTHDSFAAHGAALGCGVVFALPHAACGLTETARVLRWLAGENAGQCGPCTFGLPALADAFDGVVAGGKRGRQALERVHALFPLVEGRGACRFPDGVVRFARTALTTFADDVVRHLAGSRCADHAPLLPTPATGAWR